MGGYTVRSVRAEDATELGAAHVAIWRATYPGLVAQSVLDAKDPEEARELWLRIAAADADPANSVIVTRCAVDDATGAIAGFVTVGPPREPNAPAPVEVWSLNVLVAHHGTGVADQLLDEALGAPGRPAYLWVATGNSRAEAYYRKRGFVADGVTRFDDEAQCHESRMVRG